MVVLAASARVPSREVRRGVRDWASASSGGLCLKWWGGEGKR